MRHARIDAEREVDSAGHREENEQGWAPCWGAAMVSAPVLLQPVLDAVDARELAEFYRQLFELRYRGGDEHTDGEADSADWLVLVDGQGRRAIAFQQTEQLTPTTWPSPAVPIVEMQRRLHKRANMLHTRLSV